MKILDVSVFKKFPVLHTQRLVMRDLRPEDAAAVFAMRKSKAVNRFIARNPAENPETIDQLVDTCIGAFQNQKGIAWAAELKDKPGKIIGTCGFNTIDPQNLRAEIGGEMATDYWGRKLAFEATEAIVNFGFDVFGLHSIEAKVMPQNRGAIALLEQLGFEQQGYFKDRIWFQNTFFDMAVYCKLAP